MLKRVLVFMLVWMTLLGRQKCSDFQGLIESITGHDLNDDDDEAMMHLPSSAAGRSSQRTNKIIPLSLSMLMNFDQYGTSSVH